MSINQTGEQRRWKKTVVGGDAPMKLRTKKHSRSKGKVKSYQKDKRDILQLVPKLRKVKKNSSTYSKD